jgi:ABC-type uncharacterized transport system substrate-binding protein
MTAAPAPASYRVRVVSSYIFDKDETPYASMGRRNRWVNGFVTSLTRQKSGLREFDLAFERTPPTQEELQRLLSRYKEEGVRLLIVPGTDTAIRIAEVNKEIPILYFGAHPENNGMELLNHPNITGVRLNLPLIWRYKNFSLLKALIPNLERVYFPLNWDSEFSFPNVKKNYELFMAKKQGFWVPGHSSNAGYRSITTMAEWLGVEHFEGPYATIEELRRGLDTVNPERSALVGFNDTVLKGEAVDTLLTFTRAKRIPLFWVNNAAIIKAAGVADFSSDFEAVGRLLGTMALSILRDGTPAKELPFQEDPGEKFTLNVAGLRELGLTATPEVEARFHEIAR